MDRVNFFLGCLRMLAFAFGAFNADCNDGSVGVKEDACYTDHGFQAEQTGSSGFSFLSTLDIQIVTDVCSSKKNDFIGTVRCMLQIIQDCGSEVSATSPSPDLAGDIVEFECQQIGKVDMKCIMGGLSSDDTTKCMQSETTKLRDQVDIMDNIEIQCAQFDTMYKCAKPALEQCGSAEANYVAKYFTGSFRSKACGGYSGGSTSIPAHPGIHTTWSAFASGTLNADCNDGSVEVKGDACFTDHGVQAQQTESGVFSITATLGIPFDTDVCSSKQSDLIGTMRCLLQINQDCGSEGSKIWPSPDLAGDIVKFECQQRGKVDMNCMKDGLSSDDTNKCVEQEIKTLSDQVDMTDNIQIQCANMDILYKCGKPALEKCGSAEVNYFAKYVTGSFRSKACGGYSGGSTAILAHPGMVFLCLFTTMLRFYMA